MYLAALDGRKLVNLALSLKSRILVKTAAAPGSFGSNPCSSMRDSRVIGLLTSKMAALLFVSNWLSGAVEC